MISLIVVVISYSAPGPYWDDNSLIKPLLTIATTMLFFVVAAYSWVQSKDRRAIYYSQGKLVFTCIGFSLKKTGLSPKDISCFSIYHCDSSNYPDDAICIETVAAKKLEEVDSSILFECEKGYLFYYSKGVYSEPILDVIKGLNAFLNRTSDKPVVFN